MRKYLSFKICGGGDIYIQLMVCKKLMQIKLLLAVLSGQHRTKAFEDFVETHNKNPGAWRSILGGTLQPQVYRKMPLRLAKYFSAQFQNKESQPQLSTWAFQITTCVTKRIEDHKDFCSGFPLELSDSDKDRYAFVIVM